MKGKGEASNSPKENKMILLAVCQNEYVYAYDHNGKNILTQKGQLHNYTDTTIAVKNGEQYDVYDENGSKIATYPCDMVNMSNIVGMLI